MGNKMINKIKRMVQINKTYYLNLKANSKKINNKIQIQKNN